MSINKVLNILGGIPRDLWLSYISNLTGPVGFILRYHFWKKKLGHLGRNTRIDIGVCFQNPHMIHIGDNCWIDRGVMLLAGLDNSSREKIVRHIADFPGKPGEVYIGNNIHLGAGCIISGISQGVYISDNCGLSAGCRIYSFVNHYKSSRNPANHDIYFTPMVSHDYQCIIEGPVFIGANTGLALNAIILPGTRIGCDSFIAINSMVIGGTFDENILIAGCPAKIRGFRYPNK